MGPCKKCRSRHNSLLHVESDSREQAALVSHASYSCSVLLSTALLIVHDSEGNPHKVRAI